MPSGKVIQRAATHLLALGAGWAAVRAFGPAAGTGAPVVEQVRRSGTNRPAQGTTAEGLLDAYKDPKTEREMIERRNQGLQVPRPSGTPEERAAACSDMKGDLEKELKKVQGHEGYDYPYSRALVARWVKEDPAACATWLGAMNSRVGWGDPFDAFAKSLPARQALDLMENGWLDTNRRMVLPEIAREAGGGSPAELPGILSRLRPGEAGSFMGYAVSSAKAGDAAIWLQIAGSDEKLLASLADKWMVAPAGQPSGPEGVSAREVELALEASTGTPAEALFHQRHEAAMFKGEVDEALARIPAEPMEAAAALESIYRDHGLEPEEARKKVAESISQQYRNGLDDWKRAEWESSLQQAVLGSMTVRDAVEARLVAIDGELPEMFRGTSRASALKDAMAIEPAAVIEVALARGMESEGLEAAARAARSLDVSLSVKGEVYQALSSHDLPTSGGNLPDVKTFAAKYFEDDPEAAQGWRRSLPTALATSLEEVMR